MKLSDFQYELPQELIAQSPLKQRDASRLLAVDRQNHRFEHRHFYDLPAYLRPGDCLVINTSKVLPARLYGKNPKHTTPIEVVLLKNVEANIWEMLVRPGKRVPVGDTVVLGDGKLEAKILSIGEGGVRVAELAYKGEFYSLLDEIGQMPLPPYITRRLEEKDRYQTVYAKQPGSAAAPTAGLHFTPELLDLLSRQGVQIAHVTLHVGLGTFRPVKVEEISEHKMHCESYFVDEKDADLINCTRQNGGRVIAVGTTSIRTLESAADENGMIRAGGGETEIFIYPGYRFKAVDGLITNFHLPGSTLLMLISAFYDREKILALYREAIKEQYRFFSFGDAMLLL